MNKLSKKVGNQGFTLIEILVVIGIIAVLAAVVLIAINPARQFAQANNSQRTANTNAILNAIGQYMADNQGSLPSDIEDEGDEVDAVELCAALVPDYMPALPVDPKVTTGPVEEADCATAPNTDYMVEHTTSARIKVCATETEDEGEDTVDDICVTR